MATTSDQPRPVESWQPPVAKTVRGQIAVNMRVWLPFLSNASWNDRAIKYTSRENRLGVRWQVQFPACCWKCRQEKGLEFTKVETVVRGFENPVAPLVLTVTAVILGVLAAILFPKLWLPAIASIAGASAIGMVWMWLKSSPEHVEVSLAACGAHRLGVQEPDAAVFDNELFVFAQSAELASVARKEQTAARRAGRAGAPLHEPAADEPRPAATGGKKKKKSKESEDAPPAAPLPSAPRREELPPIKLDE